MVQTKTILVGGGSGFVGRQLVSLLRNSGAKVHVITRYPNKDPHSITWDKIKAEGIPQDTNSVINLAGRNIMVPGYWSQDYKNEVYESRISTNKILVDAIHKAQQKPSSFVTVSGVGYYRPDEQFEYTEDWSQSENEKELDYLMGLARDWEKAGKLDESLAPNTRRVIIRSGVVLGANGGVVQNSRFFFSKGFGGPIGSGQQWFPWIHVADLAEMFKFAVINEHVTGIINGVAPEQARNLDFARAFAQAFNKSAPLPVPAFMVKIMFGSERAGILLNGQKVKSRASLLGLQYKYPGLREACKECAQSA